MALSRKDRQGGGGDGGGLSTSEVNALIAAGALTTSNLSDVGDQSALDALSTSGRVALASVTADFGEYRAGEVLFYDLEDAEWRNLSLLNVFNAIGTDLPDATVPANQSKYYGKGIFIHNDGLFIMSRRGIHGTAADGDWSTYMDDDYLYVRVSDPSNVESNRGKWYYNLTPHRSFRQLKNTGTDANPYWRWVNINLSEVIDDAVFLGRFASESEAENFIHDFDDTKNYYAFWQSALHGLDSATFTEHLNPSFAYSWINILGDTPKLEFEEVDSQAELDALDITHISFAKIATAFDTYDVNDILYYNAEAHEWRLFIDGSNYETDLSVIEAEETVLFADTSERSRTSSDFFPITLSRAPVAGRFMEVQIFFDGIQVGSTEDDELQDRYNTLFPFEFSTDGYLSRPVHTSINDPTGAIPFKTAREMQDISSNGGFPHSTLHVAKGNEDGSVLRLGTPHWSALDNFVIRVIEKRFNAPISDGTETDLAEGTRTPTTVEVTSSSGENAELQGATKDLAGIFTRDQYRRMVENMPIAWENEDDSVEVFLSSTIYNAIGGANSNVHVILSDTHLQLGANSSATDADKEIFTNIVAGDLIGIRESDVLVALFRATADYDSNSVEVETIFNEIEGHQATDSVATFQTTTVEADDDVGGTVGGSMDTLWSNVSGVLASTSTSYSLENNAQFSNYDIIFAEFIYGGDNHLSLVLAREWLEAHTATQYMSGDYFNRWFRIQRSSDTRFRFHSSSDNDMRLYNIRGVAL